VHLVGFIITISSCQYSEAQQRWRKHNLQPNYFTPHLPQKNISAWFRRFIATMVPYSGSRTVIFFNLKSSHFGGPQGCPLTPLFQKKKKKNLNFIHQEPHFSFHKIAFSINRGGCYFICNVFPSSLKEGTQMKSSTVVAQFTVIRAEILRVFVCHL